MPPLTRFFKPSKEKITTAAEHAKMFSMVRSTKPKSDRCRVSQVTNPLLMDSVVTPSVDHMLVSKSQKAQVPAVPTVPSWWIWWVAGVCENMFELR